MKRFLSLGAGVQSSTLALMIAHGELEPVEAAIFADTGWEPRKVYEWLDWLNAEIQRCPHPFPIYRVSSGNLRQDIIDGVNSKGKSFDGVPWHLVKANNEPAMGKRQCTADYKIKPLMKKQRELAGLKPYQRSKGVVCETYIGISTDEALRMKPSRDVWNVNRWPLIEKGMARHDCFNWMERKGYPLPPKSSCIGCPFHSDHEWRLIKADPEAWEDAIKIDKLLRERQNSKLSSIPYMHSSRVPLDQVDLSTAADHGQVDMFNNECEGMCGV